MTMMMTMIQTQMIPQSSTIDDTLPPEAVRAAQQLTGWFNPDANELVNNPSKALQPIRLQAGPLDQEGNFMNILP